MSDVDTETVTIKTTVDVDGKDVVTFGTCPAGALPFWKSRGYEQASEQEAAEHEARVYGVTIEQPEQPEQAEQASVDEQPPVTGIEAPRVVDTPAPDAAESDTTSPSTAGDASADSTPTEPATSERRGRR